MIKKTFIAAAVTAAALGTGGAAVAATQGGAAANLAASSAAAAPTATTATPATKKAKAAKRAKQPQLGRALHGTWVTRKGKKAASTGTATTVTHDAIRGTVSAVSATSITVTAADKFSQTYAVNGATKVQVANKTTHKPTASTIGAVKNGAIVVVRGTGTTKLTAAAVVVAKTK